MVEEELLQELSSKTATRRNTSKRMRFEHEDMIRNSVERATRKDNWTDGQKWGRESWKMEIR